MISKLYLNIKFGVHQNTEVDRYEDSSLYLSVLEIYEENPLQILHIPNSKKHTSIISCNESQFACCSFITDCFTVSESERWKLSFVAIVSSEVD